MLPTGDGESAVGGGKQYDFLLKFLLVGDSDVGKEEILNGLAPDGSGGERRGGGAGGNYDVVDHTTTTLLLDGKRVRLQLWSASGQGRFCTVLRSYSRGAQGVLIVYDITNRWSFDGLDRWLREVDAHAPGVPRVLVGNRLHFAFRREVSEAAAAEYAHRHGMPFFEASPLCSYNVVESLTELSRVALQRNGMRRCCGGGVPPLRDLCCRAVVAHTPPNAVAHLPLPRTLRAYVRSYAAAAGCGSLQRPAGGSGGGSLGRARSFSGRDSRSKQARQASAPPLQLLPGGGGASPTLPRSSRAPGAGSGSGDRGKTCLIS